MISLNQIILYKYKKLTFCSFGSWESPLEHKMGTLGHILPRKVQCMDDRNATFLCSAHCTAPIRNSYDMGDHIYNEGRIEDMVPNLKYIFIVSGNIWHYRLKTKYTMH